MIYQKKACPALGLVLGLILVCVSSETWGRKLDLTIPSLETPSTWHLDSKVKREITMGLTCCYRSSLVKSVQEENFWKSTELQSKAKLKKLPFTRQVDVNRRRAIFYTLNAVDAYQTYYAVNLKDIAEEKNPFFGSSPSLERIILLKYILYYTAENSDIFYQEDTMEQLNWLYALVTLNNLDVILSQ